MRRIEDRISRQVRFCKRRSGLLKKAFELALLCDAEVALLVFSPAGKLYEYASSSIDTTYRRFKKFTRAEGGANKEDIDEDTKDLQIECEDGSNSTKLLDLNKCPCRCSTEISQMNARELDDFEATLMECMRQIKSRREMKETAILEGMTSGVKIEQAISTSSS